MNQSETILIRSLSRTASQAPPSLHMIVTLKGGIVGMMLTAETVMAKREGLKSWGRWD